MFKKPSRLFGRDVEWRELMTFASDPNLGATLGLLYGRRRQGKTLMLELLTEQTKGFIFAATQQSEAQNLADIGAAYAAFKDLRQPVVFRDWREAINELVRFGEEHATPVVIDEFPYLVSATPALPSYLQQALSPRGHAKRNTQTRIILCGSALTTMSQLLSGSAPLRGRATMELVVRPFPFRDAAAFWDVGHDPLLAFRLNALVGGTPAYLEMSGGAVPKASADLDKWVQQRLLNPASAMFREGGLLLREEPSIADPTSYAAVLAALASGRYRRSEIAAALGRPSSSLPHLLSGLRDIGLIEAIDDALREKRSVFQIAEPLVRLHQLIVARHEPELIAGRAARVWQRNKDTVMAKIYGPHFERIARQWCFDHASEETLGGFATHVRPTEIGCREHRHGHEIDVVVTETSAFRADRVTAIGEAKAQSDPLKLAQLERLEHLRALLPASKVTAIPKLLLFSQSGFSDDLVQTAGGRSDIELIDLNRLYRGD